MRRDSLQLRWPGRSAVNIRLAALPLPPQKTPPMPLHQPDGMITQALPDAEWVGHELIVPAWPGPQKADAPSAGVGSWL